jgi:endonuclease YncB( thermonuclease family)
VTGTVVSVGDGDTVTVRDADSAQHRVRFFAIDAPESAQEFGPESKAHLSSRVLGKPVCVVVIEKDRYGREVGTVFVDGEDMNLAQLRAGLAWHYKAHQREQSATDRAAYDKAEDQARAERQGLWKEPVAIAPWDYRKVHPPR